MSEPAKARTTPESKVFGAEGWNRRMRIARERAGLSVENVAKALGVTPSAVRNWEGAHKFPSREYLRDFAKLTAVDVVWVITGFNTEELKLAGKLVGQARAVPLLQPNELTEQNPQAYDDAPIIFASFPCSDAAFAIRVFDHWNSPDYEPGEIVILDPVVKYVHDDWVLATVGPARFIIFARFVLPGLDLQVEEQIKHIIAQAKEQITKGRDLLIEAVGQEETLRYIQEVREKIKAEGGPPPRTAWLVPLRGQPIPFCHTTDRVLGTMVEHRRRYPRRTLSPADFMGSHKRG
jgi:transcriptional regulator with XRE-family HTH domain